MARISCVMAVGILTLLVGSTGAASMDRSEIRTAAWTRFASIAGVNAQVHWSAVDDVPIVIRGDASASALRGFATHHAATIASMFDQQASLFRLRSGIDAFRTSEEREQRGIHHLRMIQTYHGMPVRGGQYMVSVGSDGRLRMMGGRSVPDVDADTTPVVSEAQAIAMARSARGIAVENVEATASLAIEPTDARDRLVWQVVIGARSRPGEWEVLVDARDGTVVSSRSRAFGATGCAAIFDPSPNLPAREDDFVIGDPPAGSGARLAGPLARVFEENAPALVVDSLAVPNGCFDFHFDPDSAAMKFDVTNVYWQADHFLREFHGGNGFRGFPQPMTMFVHPFRCGDPNTAETIANTVWISAGGCGYKPASRDGDIIDHEIQHVVNNSFGMEGGLDLNREIYATALHESYANYFSCAAHNDPVYGEYSFGPAGFANCNSDPDEYNYSRRLELGVGILQNYLVGMIWSGALWDIRKVIGPVIDQIALESLSYLSSQPTMHEAAEAILQADLDHHGAAYQSRLVAGFARRGIAAPPLTVAITGRSLLMPGEETSYSMNACCTGSPYSYLWTRIPDHDTTVVESLGTASQITVSAGEESFRLRVRATNAWGATGTATQRVQVVRPALTIDGPLQVRPDQSNLWAARFSADGFIPVPPCHWFLRCIDGDCPEQEVRMGESVRLQLGRRSVLRVSAELPGYAFGDSIVIEVDAPPRVSVSGPDQLEVGTIGTLNGAAAGGLLPYTWVWTTGSVFGNVISNQPWVNVAVASGGVDVVLVVYSRLGMASTPVVHTIAPANVPLVANINGPNVVRAGGVYQWWVQFGANPPATTTTYQWTRTCLDPDCAPVTIGAQSYLEYAANRNFDLGLTVTSGTRSLSLTKRIRIDGMPSATMTAPEWLASGEPALLKAKVEGGRGPFTFRWTRDAVVTDAVLGTQPTLPVRGDGQDLDLYLTVTSSEGLQSDAAHVVIRSGLGPRAAPDHPVFRVDRPMSRDGGDVTFTLEGPPGSPAGLRLLDISGREVADVFHGTLSQGFEFIGWRPGTVPSGVYLAVAQIAGQRITRRVTVVR